MEKSNLIKRIGKGIGMGLLGGALLFTSLPSCSKKGLEEKMAPVNYPERIVKEEKVWEYNKDGVLTETEYNRGDPYTTRLQSWIIDGKNMFHYRILVFPCKRKDLFPIYDKFKKEIDNEVGFCSGTYGNIPQVWKDEKTGEIWVQGQ